MALDALEYKEERAIAALGTAVYALIGLYLLVAIVQRVALFADGSYWFLRLLLESEASRWNPRWSSYAILSAPMALAVRSGVRELNTLEIIFGIGMYAHFAVMAAICARTAGRRWHLLLFPAASFFLVSANMGFWPFTGSHVLVSLFWSLLFLLVLPTTHTRGWVALTVSLSVLATSAFESMLLLGPVLAVVALWRWHRDPDPVRRVGAVVTAAACAGGTVVALIGVQMREPGHFTKSAFGLMNSNGYVHGLLILSMACFVLIVTAGSRRQTLWRAGAAALAIAVLGWLGACLLAAEDVLNVSLHHDVRTFNLWFTLALAAAFLWWAKPEGNISRTQLLRAWRVVSLVAVAQTLWLIGATVHWQHYLTLIGREVGSGSGILPFESSTLNQDTDEGRVMRPFLWGWSFPVHSVLRAPAGDVRAVIANPKWYEGWTAFDPVNPVALSGLERYGVRLSYLTAISTAR